MEIFHRIEELESVNQSLGAVTYNEVTPLFVACDLFRIPCVFCPATWICNDYVCTLITLI